MRGWLVAGLLLIAGGAVATGPAAQDAGSGLPCGAMVPVPAGAFWMGAGDEDPESAPDERPRHEVSLRGYAIEVYEVSHGCYTEFVEAGGYLARRAWSEAGWRWRTRHGIERSAFWDEATRGQPRDPVVGVSWFEAEAYCRWRGRRLPTEAEWEKAARGPDGRRYPWGGEWSAERANGAVSVGRIVAVGSYPRGTSLYGAHDLAGNVWEWVADRYGKSYYADSPATDPPGPADGESRVLRGGAWNFPPRHLRAAARTHLPPETRIRYLGFRCATSP
jgi:formylglycine-generating enzyme required for sulfatase activity